MIKLHKINPKTLEKDGVVWLDKITVVESVKYVVGNKDMSCVRSHDGCLVGKYKIWESAEEVVGLVDE